MSTESGSSQVSEPRRRREADPLQMTEHEKRVAEWEARHDVAARGHRVPPDVLQHYLAHERAIHPERPGRPVAAGGGSHDEAPPPVVPPPVVPPPPAVQPERRGWLRRLLHRRG